jgi:hypothetical protein
MVAGSDKKDYVKLFKIHVYFFKVDLSALLRQNADELCDFSRPAAVAGGS